MEGVMTREEKVAVVESDIHGLGNGDFSRVPFADDVALWSPLTPRRSAQDAISFLSNCHAVEVAAFRFAVRNRREGRAAAKIFYRAGDKVSFMSGGSRGVAEEQQLGVRLPGRHVESRAGND
jgi:hypothetical protein